MQKLFSIETEQLLSLHTQTQSIEQPTSSYDFFRCATQLSSVTTAKPRVRERT